MPAVLSRCNEQSTYEMPKAPETYAWLHLLDRYVRTWLALELLVKKSCIAMGEDGVRALDIGTGPGPAGFAVHDFYTAMVEFSELYNNLKWRQPPHITCVELDPGTNSLGIIYITTKTQNRLRKKVRIDNMKRCCETSCFMF